MLSVACRAWIAIAVSRSLTLAADLQPKKDCHVNDETSMLQVSQTVASGRGSLEEDYEQRATPSRAMPSHGNTEAAADGASGRRTSEMMSTEDIMFLNGLHNFDGLMMYSGDISKEVIDFKIKPQGALFWSPKIHGKIWDDNQCNNVGNKNGGSLEGCKDLCVLSISCNAINFNPSINDCILRACPMPIPFPFTNTTGYHGYHLQLHHDKQVTAGLALYNDKWDHEGQSNISKGDQALDNRVQSVEDGLVHVEAQIEDIDKDLTQLNGALGKTTNSSAPPPAAANSSAPPPS